MKGIAIVAAAGKGSRFGEDKVWVKLQGKTLLERAAEPFFSSPAVDAVLIVISEEREKDAEKLFADREKKCLIVIGGDTRTESVRRALFAAKNIADGEDAIVAIHDGARPYLSSALVERCFSLAAEKGSAIPVVKPVDSMRKIANGENRAVSRDEYVLVQTPQCFLLDRILKAYEAGTESTDDATLYEKRFGAPALTEGEIINKKITYVSDLSEENSFSERRVGVGYDVHQLVFGRDLILGGVRIPFEKGLDGHSDADCLTHAVMDALLTAAGLPDIGHLFPTDDPAYEGANSLELLRIVARKIANKSFRAVNVAGMIMAEKPKMAPHLPFMEKNIAEILGISEQNVKFSATTTEKLGIVGEGKGIAAEATVLLERVQ